MYRFTQNKMMYIIFGLFFLMTPRTADAYLDPGTGSYIFQIIIAAFVGIAFTFKIYWTKIKTFLGDLFSKKS